ncbi:hypothetical protein SAMN03159341_103378 [Paenibacillus sp. 1_12]|uniref:hypothetical protein n=1 Tax=Paenibacillus sp. 1_12 TaxID=1566278 RepID=UPI0008E84C5E|nr:hypothetical protein [Paenibacillus sp. 1_12]SFL12846.1 hypothetical protein SAMN03159341_103378 [Paenibacillus sp. 1_12]
MLKKIGKIAYNVSKYSSVQGIIAHTIYEKVKENSEEKKKMNEIKRKQEDAIADRIRTSRKVEMYETSDTEGEISGGFKGESEINGKVFGKNGKSRKIIFED